MMNRRPIAVWVTRSLASQNGHFTNSMRNAPPWLFQRMHSRFPMLSSLTGLSAPVLRRTILQPARLVPTLLLRATFRRLPGARRTRFVEATLLRAAFLGAAPFGLAGLRPDFLRAVLLRGFFRLDDFTG